jgi:hypothetical protein
MKPYPRLLKFIRRLLLLLATTATLLAGIVIVENWRGDRAWAAAERELRARGEPLDLSAFQTPPIPDDRNFFKAPVIDQLLSWSKRDDPQAKRLWNAANLDPLGQVLIQAFYGRRPGRVVSTPNDPSGSLHFAQTELLKLKLITEPLSSEPATDILAAMKPAQALLDSVGQAARERPDARLPIIQYPFEQTPLNYDETFRLGKILACRAKVELALGRTDDAFADTLGILGLARATQTAGNPLLGILVSAALRQSAANVLKDGCRRSQWSDSQLAEFQQQLPDPQAFEQLKQSFQTTRLVITQILDAPSSPASGNDDKTLPWWLFHGWLQQNKVTMAKGFSDLYTVFDPVTARVFPLQVEPLKKRLDEMQRSRLPYGWVNAHWNMRTNLDVITNFGADQNSLRLAVTACALERHRLAHGGYPASLVELVPAFLAAVPADVFTGQPLGYTRTPDGGFKLTSLPADGKPAREAENDPRVWVQAGVP